MDTTIDPFEYIHNNSIYVTENHKKTICTSCREKIYRDDVMVSNNQYNQLSKQYYHLDCFKPLFPTPIQDSQILRMLKSEISYKKFYIWLTKWNTSYAIQDPFKNEIDYKIQKKLINFDLEAKRGSITAYNALSRDNSNISQESNSTIASKQDNEGEEKDVKGNSFEYNDTKNQYLSYSQGSKRLKLLLSGRRQQKLKVGSGENFKNSNFRKQNQKQYQEKQCQVSLLKILGKQNMTYILTFVSIQDIIYRLKFVSKEFYEICWSNTLWKFLNHRDFNQKIVNQKISQLKNEYCPKGINNQAEQTWQLMNLYFKLEKSSCCFCKMLVKPDHLKICPIEKKPICSTCRKQENFMLLTLNDIIDFYGSKQLAQVLDQNVPKFAYNIEGNKVFYKKDADIAYDFYCKYVDYSI